MILNIKKTLGLMLLSLLAVGCTAHELDAPCRNFGQSCSQIPINN